MNNTKKRLLVVLTATAFIAALSIASLAAINDNVASPKDATEFLNISEHSDHDHDNIVGTVKVTKTNENGEEEFVGATKIFRKNDLNNNDNFKAENSDTLLTDSAISIIKNNADSPKISAFAATCGTKGGHSMTQYASVYDIALFGGTCLRYNKAFYVCNNCRYSYEGGRYNESSHKTGSYGCFAF